MMPTPGPERVIKMPTNDSFKYNSDGREQPPASSGPSGETGPPADELPGWTSEITLDDVRRIYVKQRYESFEPVFASCDAAGGMQPSLVVGPLFIGFAWFFYRKMYMEGLILMGLGFVLMLMGGAVLQASPETGRKIVIGLNLVCLLGMMVYGKALYWKAVDRKIARAMRAFPDDPQKALAWLDRVGGTNLWIVLIFFALVFFMFSSLTADLAMMQQSGGM